MMLSTLEPRVDGEVDDASVARGSGRRRGRSEGRALAGRSVPRSSGRARSSRTRRSGRTSRCRVRVSVVSSALEDSIVMEGSRIEGVRTVRGSILGRNAEVRHSGTRGRAPPGRRRPESRRGRLSRRAHRDRRASGARSRAGRASATTRGRSCATSPPPIRCPSTWPGTCTPGACCDAPTVLRRRRAEPHRAREPVPGARVPAGLVAPRRPEARVARRSTSTRCWRRTSFRPATRSRGVVLVVHDLAYERFPEMAPQIDAQMATRVPPLARPRRGRDRPLRERPARPPRAAPRGRPRPRPRHPARRRAVRSGRRRRRSGRSSTVSASGDATRCSSGGSIRGRT